MAQNNTGKISKEDLRLASDYRDTFDDISSSVKQLGDAFRKVTNESAGSFKETRNILGGVKDIAKEFAKLDENSNKGGKKINAILEAQNKLRSKSRQLQVEIEKIQQKYFQTLGSTNAKQQQQNKYLGKQLEHLQNAEDAVKDLQSLYAKILSDNKNLNNNTKYLDKLSGMTDGKVSKFFSNLSEHYKTQNIAKQEAIDLQNQINQLTEEEQKTGKGLTKDRLGELGLLDKIGGVSGVAAVSKIKELSAGTEATIKSTQGLGKAFSAAGDALRAAFPELYLLDIIVEVYKAFKWVGKQILEVDQRTTDFARELGVSKDNARGLVNELIAVKANIEGTYMTWGNTSKAIANINQQLDRTGVHTIDALESQVIMTNNMKVQEDLAAKVNARSIAFGESAMGNLEVILDQNKKLSTQGQSLITGKKLLEEVGKASGQIAASFGFSNINIANAVHQVRRFGLNLQQAKTIADGLLDFESSLTSELESELLIGKDLNLDKARYLALTGDIVGSTQEVMKTMKGLTAEQRKSPLIMQSFAKMTGLSVDELQDAYMLETDRNRQAEELLKVYREQGAVAGANYAAAKGFTQDDLASAKKKVSLEENYNQALEEAKDQFQAFVNGGYINQLQDAISGISKLVGWLAPDSAEEKKEKQAEAVKLKKENPEIYKAISSPVHTIPMATGGITTGPTNALIGEAGTEAVIPLNDFYAKLDEVVKAVNQVGQAVKDGKNITLHTKVNYDANKASQESMKMLTSFA
jgi:hypothetical protein